MKFRPALMGLTDDEVSHICDESNVVIKPDGSVRLNGDYTVEELGSQLPYPAMIRALLFGPRLITALL